MPPENRRRPGRAPQWEHSRDNVESNEVTLHKCEQNSAGRQRRIRSRKIRLEEISRQRRQVGSRRWLNLANQGRINRLRLRRQRKLRIATGDLDAAIRRSQVAAIRRSQVAAMAFNGRTTTRSRIKADGKLRSSPSLKRQERQNTKEKACDSLYHLVKVKAKPKNCQIAPLRRISLQDQSSASRGQTE